MNIWSGYIIQVRMATIYLATIQKRKNCLALHGRAANVERRASD